MAHQILARFSDGGEHRFEAAHDALLLDAALAAGLPLMHQCRAGSCSSCVCQGVAGDAAMDLNTSVGLLPREIAEGKLLTCLARVRSDLEVQFRYPLAAIAGGVQRAVAELVAVERVAPEVVQLDLRLPDDAGPDAFAPGQYFMLGVPGGTEQRAYSPASTAQQLPYLRFLIRLLPGGLMSDYLATRAAPGDSIAIEGPHGQFAWQETKAPLLMLAGGTGLAPILSILDTIAARRRHRAGIALLFGVTDPNSLFYLDELALRAATMPRLSVHLAMARPDAGWSGHGGFVTDLLAEAAPGPNSEAYVCGPPAMVERSVELLTGFGLAADAIRFESFRRSS